MYFVNDLAPFYSSFYILENQLILILEQIWTFLFLFLAIWNLKEMITFMSHSLDRNWYIQEKWDSFSLLFKPWTLFGKRWRKSWHWNISWNTKSDSIECDSSHLDLKKRWRKSEILESNENEENLCVIFEEKFILVQNFLKIASCNWKNENDW